MTRTKGTPQIPPGITTHRRATPGGMVYEFDHERLGIIGRLSLLVQGAGQTQVAVDTAPGDPVDPLWEERFAMLYALARTCLLALGEQPFAEHEGGKGQSAALSALYRDPA